MLLQCVFTSIFTEMPLPTCNERSMNMKRLFSMMAVIAVLSGAIWPLSVHAQSQDKPIVNPYGKYLEGDGLKIEIATYLEKNKDGLNDMLVKVIGAAAYEAGIDSKTLRYTAVPAGTGYNLQRNGRNLLSVRSPYGRWQQIEVYLAGRTYHVVANDGLAENVRPLHLLTAYEQEKK